MQWRRRVLLKMIESRHVRIGKELEANLGDAGRLYDYGIVLKLSGNETNIAENIVLEYAHFTSSSRLAGTGKGRTTSPLH